MRGHEEASGTKYVPKELQAHWATKDPVENYEQFLLKQGVINREYIETKRKEIKKEIEDGLAVAFEETHPVADTESEITDVLCTFYAAGYCPSCFR